MSSPSSSSTQMSSSAYSIINQTQPSLGSVTEVFKLPCAALLQLDYDDDKSLRFLRHGGFVVNLIMQSSSPVLMVSCMVEKFQWPITKDAPVIRIGTRSFAFAMPGILYGLQFPLCCEEEMIDTLERVFMKFACYKDLNEGEAGYPYADTTPNLWSKMRTQIENIAHNTLAQFGHSPGKSLSTVGSQASGLLRALRTSASTKMVGDAILSGALKAMHIEIQDLRPQQKCSEQDNQSIIFQQAFPSICVFSNLVEAVEVAWVAANGESHLLKEKPAKGREGIGGVQDLEIE
ncbi:hypothetical protein Pint_26694 [Pistacia integerrima]|uniref:Uncharacterized protein n=1 Tax=Pistacia integerrima TaxID=434235 RepID=A0ACC0YM97_9ROSI|nr:hypothetical protein Pint_26694 [Pistacia integerrima]